jgi:hypothetical protein
MMADGGMELHVTLSHPPRSFMRKVWIALGAMFLFTALYGWAVDFITAQGETTIYTVDCAQGTWAGNRCTGDVVAGGRYRFLALPLRGEVLFWIVGAAEPPGKFAGCNIADARNWTCPPSLDVSRSIALSMSHGRPVPDPQQRTRPSHNVSKLRWLAIRQGLRLGVTADE